MARVRGRVRKDGRRDDGLEIAVTAARTDGGPSSLFSPRLAVRSFFHPLPVLPLIFATFTGTFRSEGSC